MTEQAERQKLKVVAVANQKGGVGKTTTSVNLAASLGWAKRRTLLIDLDPQGNASGGLGIDRHTSATIYDVLIGRKELTECIQPTLLPDLFVIPANQNLIGAEVELVNAISREKKLKVALKKIPPEFEFVIFDCPPSLGLLTINAFTASDSILIPTQCEYYAMEGLGQLLNTYQIVREDLNETLDIEGVVLTMFDTRNKLTHEVVREMKSHFPDKLYETFIPRNVKLSESPSFGKPIVLYDPESKGCTAYLGLAQEFLRRNGHPNLFIAPPVLDDDGNVVAAAPEVNVKDIPAGEEALPAPVAELEAAAAQEDVAIASSSAMTEAIPAAALETALAVETENVNKDYLIEGAPSQTEGEAETSDLPPPSLESEPLPAEPTH